MSTSNTTNTGAILKELYSLPPVRVLRDKSFLHDKLAKEKPTMDFSGRYAYFPVTLQRNLGRGSRGDAGNLPVAGTETIDDAKVYIKRHYYALEWSEAIEVASKNKEGAFENVVTMKMKNVAIDMAKEANRQLYNASQGKLGTITAGATSVTQTLDSVQYIYVGDSVDFITANGVTNTGTRAVTGVDRTASTITVASVATTTGDFVVLEGNFAVSGGGGESYEVEGLRHICAEDRSLHTIDSTTYEEWDGNATAMAAATAGESSFEQLYDDIGSRQRGDMDTYLTTRGIRRRLADEFASQRRYLNEKAVDIKAGYSAIEVNGKPCIIDDDCPKKTVFGLTLDTLKIMEAIKPGFLETEAGDGAVVELKDSSTAGQKVAVWQSWYRYHWTLACLDPGRNGMLTGCADEAN